MTGSGGLVVVGTPIGNLDDLGARAAAHLRDADLVACEDTRRTATLLRHAGADTRMMAVHQHNEAARAADLVARMLAGETVALVSDAGMPLISDPGARLVGAAIEAGCAVTVVPGASAVTTALAASGLAGDGRFCFLGFVPRKGAERRATMEQIGALTTPAVCFESPQRLPALLSELAAVWPDRSIAVCRELTKLHEEVVRGSAAELAAVFTEPPRGEIAVVIGAAIIVDPDDQDERLRDTMVILLDAGLGAARAADVAVSIGLTARNRAYRVALAVVEERRSAT